MTIAEVRDKCKSLLSSVPRDGLIVAILVLAASLSFGLGYLAGLDAGHSTTISFENDPGTLPAADAAAGQVVASKSGTKYYLPQCAGATRISETNKVWFPSASAAQKAGYAPSANCTGL